MLDPEGIATRDFVVSLRGYDRDQVRAFQQEVADTVEELGRRVAELGAQVERLQRQAEATAPAAGDGDAQPAAMFAEIGAETERILRAAQEAAEQIRRKARSDADAQRRQAQAEAARLVADGQRRRDEAEAMVTRLTEERERLAERLRAVGLAVDRALEELAPSTARASVREALAATVRQVPRAHPPASQPPPGPAPQPEPAHEPQAHPEPAPAPVPEPEPEPAPQAEPEPEPAPVPEPEPAPLDPVVLRSEALTPLHPKLVRKLKRELQEVQNIVLDRVRRARGRGQPADFLPAGEEFAGLGSSREHLERAWRAGVEAGGALAGREVGAVGDPPELAEPFVGDAGERLRSALGGTLRVGLAGGEGAQPLADRIGTVFGDFKAGQADELAAGHLLRAYELGLRGAWAAAGVPARRWVLGREPRCPEARCRQNDQSQPLPLDKPFPSGHEVPPVHAGCTCTTAPVDA